MDCWGVQQQRGGARGGAVDAQELAGAVPVLHADRRGRGGGGWEGEAGGAAADVEQAPRGARGRHVRDAECNGGGAHEQRLRGAGAQPARAAPERRLFPRQRRRHHAHEARAADAGLGRGAAGARGEPRACGGNDVLGGHPQARRVAGAPAPDRQRLVRPDTPVHQRARQPDRGRVLGALAGVPSEFHAHGGGEAEPRERGGKGARKDGCGAARRPHRLLPPQVAQRPLAGGARGRGGDGPAPSDGIRHVQGQRRAQAQPRPPAHRLLRPRLRRGIRHGAPVRHCDGRHHRQPHARDAPEPLPRARDDGRPQARGAPAKLHSRLRREARHPRQHQGELHRNRHHLWQHRLRVDGHRAQRRRAQRHPHRHHGLHRARVVRRRRLPQHVGRV
mmetsp:Transcript_4357/g.15095  ORF Transcript_4357/g.15095 Transcript_4357/m.15095 type:complete len:390 (-) Transcript_4357:403-1572(-)